MANAWNVRYRTIRCRNFDACKRPPGREDPGPHAEWQWSARHFFSVSRAVIYLNLFVSG